MIQQQSRPFTVVFSDDELRKLEEFSARLGASKFELLSKGLRLLDYASKNKCTVVDSQGVRRVLDPRAI